MDKARARRRIDRLTAPDYLHDLDSRDVTELRRMRDECREEETHLSYARRVLQAQIDVARSEAARRTGEADTASLLAQLPTILADPPPAERRDARSVTIHHPEGSGQRVGDLDAPGAALSRLPDLSDAQLADLIGMLSDHEQRVSHERRTVLDHLDSLQAELVRRYRDGSAAIDQLVAPTPDDSPA